MKSFWFSPLAPAIMFLAGAFIMVIMQHLRAGSKTRLKSYVGLAVTGLVFLNLATRIGTRLTSSSFDPPLVFSPWGAVDAGLTTRLDGMGLAFLFIPVLLLIAVFWARQINNHAIVLGLAASAAFVFVAANGISFSYALMLFDTLGCIYWLYCKQTNMALARLVLGVFTTSSLMLAGLASMAELGGYLLAFTLWLRISLFPFIETLMWARHKEAVGETLIWFTLSTVTGLYLAARFLFVPSSTYLQVITIVLIVLNAWLAWVGNSEEEGIRVKLLRMILIQPSMVLLISPLPILISITLGLGYSLSLGALWLTPRIGRPNLFERNWLWIYAAPVLATLTLVGFPYTFGWVAYGGIFSQLMIDNAQVVVVVLLLSEGIAFSALYHYWQCLLNGSDKADKALWTALILTIPFLLPGVAGITFRAITKLDFIAIGAQFIELSLIGPGLVIVWLLAVTFGLGRRHLLKWLNITPHHVEYILSLSWIWGYLGGAVAGVDHFTLRIKAVLEGSHYLGWAFLIALTGLLVVVLS